MFRKLLAVPAALIAVVAFSPAAHANIASLEVGGVASPDTVTFANKSAVSVTMGSLGATCTSASGTATAAGGTLTDGATYLTFAAPSGLSLIGCTGPGGLPVTITQRCDITVKTDNPVTVTTAISDVVNGTLNAGTAANPCLRATTTGWPCTVDIYGSTTAVFNETQKPSSNYQDLTISGSGLTLTNVGALCAGVSNGDPVTLNLPFWHTSAPTKALNFKP